MASGIKQFHSSLITRLQRGEHLVLHGPRGSGKSTLLAKLHTRLARAGVPCALSSTTSCLDDITSTFAHAYPEVDTITTTRRKARARLVSAADHRAGVLLLDQVTTVNTAMIGFLRRLRGGFAGVLLAVDVDKECDRQHLRHRHLGTLSLPMPLASPRRLRRLFRACCTDGKVPRLSPVHERQIMRAAHGRPGWIVQCAHFISQRRYWRDSILHVSVLCVDTEIALRQGQLKLLLPKQDSG
jgi:predicted ATPase